MIGFRGLVWAALARRIRRRHTVAARGTGHCHRERVAGHLVSFAVTAALRGAKDHDIPRNPAPGHKSRLRTPSGFGSAGRGNS
jgi:hypothetical protein